MQQKTRTPKKKPIKEHAKTMWRGKGRKVAEKFN